MPLPPYYKIDISRTPTIRFVLNHKRENYAIHFTKILPHVLEIVFLQEGNISEIIDGKEHTYKEGSVHTFVHNRPVNKYSNDPVMQEFTVGITCCTPCVPMTEEEVAAWTATEHEAIVPDLVEDPKVTEKLEFLMKKIVRSRRSADQDRYLQFWSTLYEILAIMTQYSVTQARSKTQKSYARENKYCRRACNYIARHLHEKISVKELADHVGVSYGYLSGLFSQTMGMTLVEYINYSKLEQVKQLIREMGMTLEEAGVSVGITDTKYLSRLFRRYIGMTVHEYKNIHT